MKAYMYDVESGLYEGETFEDEDQIKFVDGLTTIAPPTFNHGQVAVFDINNQLWSLVSASEMKERLSIVN